MKKLISVLFACLFCACMIFAQSKTAPSAGVTDADVKNFAKNYSKIEKYLDKVGDSEAEVLKTENFLETMGISGPNRIRKVVVITIAMTPAVAEYEMQKDPEAAAMVKSMGIDPLAGLKTQVDEMVNEKDYNVVMANSKLLQKIADK